MRRMRWPNLKGGWMKTIRTQARFRQLLLLLLLLLPRVDLESAVDGDVAIWLPPVLDGVHHGSPARVYPRLWPEHSRRR